MNKTKSLKRRPTMTGNTGIYALTEREPCFQHQSREPTEGGWLNDNFPCNFVVLFGPEKIKNEAIRLKNHPTRNLDERGYIPDSRQSQSINNKCSSTVRESAGAGQIRSLQLVSARSPGPREMPRTLILVNDHEIVIGQSDLPDHDLSQRPSHLDKFSLVLEPFS